MAGNEHCALPRAYGAISQSFEGFYQFPIFTFIEVVYRFLAGS